MGLFGKKKKRSLPRRYIKVGDKLIDISSREYKIYRKREKQKSNWFEKYTKFSGSFLKVNPDKTTRKNLEDAIAFTELKTTPQAVMSASVFTMFLFIIIGIPIAFLSSMMYGALFIIVGLLVGYYILKYPTEMVKTVRIRASSQVVLAVLYMVVSMRISPNLERALRFAASNVSGELAVDLRKLIWDIEIGKYTSADEAIDVYIDKWKAENEEFANSLLLIKDSQKQAYQAVERTLDEALKIVLEGTKTRMKHYTQDLKLPVMVIHMMGIVLPVLGAIMAPLASVFLAKVFNAWVFVIGYDIVLPLVIFWFITMTLKKRPITFSQIDTKEHPDIPPNGTFLIKGKRRTAFPVFPIAVLLTLLIIIMPVLYFAQNPQYILPTPEQVKAGLQFPDVSLLMSILLILGIGAGLVVYFFLTSFQAVKIQNKIEKTEGQFELALFQFGNRAKAGTPIEVAVEKSIDDLKDLEISGLFRRILRNIRSLGMPSFEQALFHKKYGALRYYPSRLIKNIMYTVVDTSKKGVSYASSAMLTISQYLKNIKETQEYIGDILSDTISSMKFQAYGLTPIITGLIVAMSEIITEVFLKLLRSLTSVGFFGGSDVLGSSLTIFDIESAMAPSLFQLIVGIYLIEVIIILAYFMTKIMHGDNKYLERNTAAKMLITGLVVYLITALVARTMFLGLVRQALGSLL